MKDMFGNNVSNIQIDTDSFHFLMYNDDLQEKIADSLKEKKMLYKNLEKKALLIDISYVMSLILVIFQKDILVSVMRIQNGL